MRPKCEHCYFCEGEHQPKDCKRYKTEESRQRVATKKKICHLCFVKSPVIHLPEDKECPMNNETCSGWYSTVHHSVFCPARIEELRKLIFLPKIDETLLNRFVETLEMDEKYLMGTSSALAQRHIPLKEVKVIEGLGWRYRSPDLSDSSTYVVTLQFHLSHNSKDHIEKLLRKEIICKSCIVALYKLKIPAEDLLQMFSSITREIIIDKINADITFTDIIERVPNIEEFEMRDNSIKVNGETWVKDLMKFKKGKNFKKLDIYLDTVEFDIELFKEFLTTKSTNNVYVTIKYDSSLSKDEIDNFAEKFRKHFIAEQLATSSYKPHIKLWGGGCSRYFTFDVETVPSKPKTSRKRTLNDQ